MNDELLEKWNSRHAEAEGLGEAAQVLLRNRHLLPARGRALDLACGRGANALLLAELGLDVAAWDFSPEAILRLQGAAAARQFEIAAEVRDVLANPPAPDSFDVILVSYFLDRALMPALQAALRPGGLLFYQTFIRDAVSATGPGNPEWRLADNELLSSFPEFRVHYYREEGSLGETNQGLRDVALLVASRPGTIPDC